MKAVPNGLGLVVGLLWVVLGSLNQAVARAEVLVLEAEVLEGSGPVAVPGTVTGPIRYAIVHHHQAQDQARLSIWLRSQSGSPVTFVTKDGGTHRGVLNRLKHCFGRGLLIYADPVGLAEKDLVRLELPTVDTKP